jgi:hypothetical protein
MITHNGKKYAKNDSEAVESLFDRTGTVNGFYKRTASGLVLSDLQGKERVFVRHSDGLTVTCHRYNGRLRYMFGLSSLDARWMGEAQ